MHLTVVCPACQSQYQVDPNLRGKRMRCPNPICRTVFDVGDAPQPASVAEPVAAAVESSPAPIAPPKWAAPPPVRAAAVAPVTQPLDAFDIPDDFPDDEPTPIPAPTPLPRLEAKSSPKKKRGPLLLVAGLLLVLAVIAGVVFKQYSSRQQKIESDVAAAAQDLYQKGDFAEAMKRFQQLQRDYPKSPDFDRYRFLATFSELRAEIDVANDPAALTDAQKHAVEFLDSYQEAPLFKTHAADVFDALLPLAKRLTQAVQETPDAVLLERAKATWDRTRPLASRSVARDDEYFNATFANLRATLAAQQRRQSALALMRAAQQSPTAAAIADAKKRIAAVKLDEDPEIVAEFKTLRDSLKSSIAFEPAGPALAAPTDDPFPLIPLVAAQGGAKAARGVEPIVVLSPTGVLYATQPRHGELLWARRLGIDSRIFPLRLTDTAPRCLAISNDRKTVELLDVVTGKTIWQHVLTAPACAEPILAPGHFLIPLTSGQVADLNPATGALTGSYQFDQPLPVGGTHHPGTSLVSLPGEANCVYVLDLTSRSCVRILETDHPAGSLVAPPIVVPGGPARQWIILAQAESGPGIRLRCLSYPPEAAGKRVEPDLHLPGTLSFSPRHDADSILLATDEGKLHRIGLRQPGNPADPLLFPLTPAEVALETLPRLHPLKAMVVHADAENLWVMSAGRLQRLRQSMSPKVGPTVKAVWPRGVWLGEPLHAAQVHADAEGVTLFIATHDPATAATRLSAVDGETGQILWQTQLGSTPRGEPIFLHREFVWLDDRHAFLAYVPDLKDPNAKAISTFPIPRSPQGTMLPIGRLAKENTTTIAGWSPQVATLTASELYVAGGIIAEPLEFKLPAPIAAPPIPHDGFAIAALTNGALVRVDFGKPTPLSGPEWRAAGADPDVPPHLVAVRPDLFVASNGKGGLSAYEWGKIWKEVARLQPTENAFVGPPLLMPGEEPRLIVVDAANNLVLLDAVRLQPVPRKDWSLKKGKVTAGPFAVGGRVYVVVDGKRLLAFDPQRDGIAWEVNFAGEIALSPVVAGDRLVVVDQGGNFWTLDPATGANLGPNERPTLSVRANLVPAVSPVVLPDGKLFVIWSDGTAAVVTLPEGVRS